MKKNDLFGIAFMLFAIFFGAGNMIFPPQLGSLGGSNWGISLLGFILTDVGLSILGVIVVSKVGDNLDSILNIISPKFAVFFTFILFLMIGPLFAIPRTGAVTYEFAFKNPSIITRVLFTVVFFGLTYILSINPSKIVTIVGKILTPLLLLNIVAIFIAISINISGGSLGTPQGDYAITPLIAGIEQGYLAMDGLAALVFATLAVTAIKEKGIKDRKTIIRIVAYTALIAGLILAVIYFMLGSIGAKSNMHGYFDNGADLLVYVTSNYLGTFGHIMLVTAVALACLTTAIGLTTSMATFVSSLKDSFDYKKTTIVIVLFSALISIIGLNQLLVFSIPVLVALYPLCIIIIFMGFFTKFLKKEPLVFTLALSFAAAASIVHGFDKAGVVIPLLTRLFSSMPLYTKDFGYLIPSIVGMIIGHSIYLIRKRK